MGRYATQKQSGCSSSPDEQQSGWERLDAIYARANSPASELARSAKAWV